MLVSMWNLVVFSQFSQWYKKKQTLSIPTEICPCSCYTHLPVSGSHSCSQGSRSRRVHKSKAQGPLEFCWEKRTTWAGFNQSLASNWLPSSRINRLPTKYAEIGGENEIESIFICEAETTSVPLSHSPNTVANV